MISKVQITTITEAQIAIARRRYLKYMAMPESPMTTAVLANIRELAFKHGFSLPKALTVTPPRQLSMFDAPNTSEYKITYNGSHFMAVRPGDNESAARERHEVTYWDSVFEDLYAKYTAVTEGERKLTPVDIAAKIAHELKHLGFCSEKETPEAFTVRKMGNISSSAAGKRRRFRCKAGFVKFNYFCTFTYDSRKISSEQEFRRKLTKLFNNLHTRYGCLFAGAFERGGKKGRLHMHALAYIPDGVQLGGMVTTKGYSLEKHEYREVTQCTYFSDRFGRNEFDVIDGSSRTQLAKHIGYITKYIAKSGEKIFYSRGIPTYIAMQLQSNDIACKSNVLIKKREIKRYVVADDIAYRYIDQIPAVATSMFLRVSSEALPPTRL